MEGTQWCWISSVMLFSQRADHYSKLKERPIFTCNWRRTCLVEPCWILPLVAVWFVNVKVAGSCRQGATCKSVTGKAEPNQLLFTRERLKMPLAAFCSCFCCYCLVVKHTDQLNNTWSGVPWMLKTIQDFLQQQGNLNIRVVGKGVLIVYLIFFFWKKRDNFCLRIVSGMKEISLDPTFK